MKFNLTTKKIKIEALVKYFLKFKVFKNKNFLNKIEKNDPFTGESVSQKL